MRRVKPAGGRSDACQCQIRHPPCTVALALALAAGGRAARTWVDVDALVPSDGMYAHDGVHRLDGLPTHGLPRRTRTVRLSDAAVHGREALEVLLEARAEGRVEGVASARMRAMEMSYTCSAHDRMRMRLTRSSRACRPRTEGP